MNQKIAELTEKIYQEGVEKAQKKAEEIRAKAQSEGAAIIADAKQQAERIVADARQQAEELRRNVEAEIKLSGQQALSAAKQRIVEVITAKILDEKTAAAMVSAEFIRDLMKILAAGWKAASGEQPSLEVLLPEAQRAEFEKAFAASAGELMRQGLQVAFSPAIKAGFRIGPAGGSFRVSMTDEDFNEFFKQYLRPRTRAFLFGE